MEYICIEVVETGERLRIEKPLWITENQNGILITPHRIKARGVSDGSRVWSFGALNGCPEVRSITLAEYEQTRIPVDPDPELSAEEALDIILGGNYESE